MAKKLFLALIALLAAAGAAQARVSRAENSYWNSHALGVVQDGKPVRESCSNEMRTAWASSASARTATAPGAIA